MNMTETMQTHGWLLGVMGSCGDGRVSVSCGRKPPHMYTAYSLGQAPCMGFGHHAKHVVLK
jgi:hypothetical protein